MDPRTTAALGVLQQYMLQNSTELNRRKQAVMDVLDGMDAYSLVPMIGYLMAQCEQHGIDTQLVISCLQLAHDERELQRNAAQS